jgi:hypothetical protein
VAQVPIAIIGAMAQVHRMRMVYCGIVQLVVVLGHNILRMISASKPMDLPNPYYRPLFFFIFHSGLYKKYLFLRF